MCRLWRQPPRRLLSRASRGRLALGSDGRKAVYSSRAHSARVCVLCVCWTTCACWALQFIAVREPRRRHFVFDRACGRACKWGIGYILVRGKLLKVETGALFAGGAGNRFDENAHDGALKPLLSSPRSPTCVEEEERPCPRPPSLPRLSRCATPMPYDCWGRRHLLERAPAGRHRWRLRTTLSSSCWRPHRSEQLLLAWRWCCRTHEGRVVCTRV